MSAYEVVREYPYPIEDVWRALTDPAYVVRWTSTGRGGRPEGFVPVAGTRFRFVGKPTIGWDGIVECEVLEVVAPRRLRYSWTGGPGDDTTLVDYDLTETPTGTRLRWRHTGFTGIGGFAMSRLLGRVRRRMLTDGLPPVLAAVHAADPAG